MKRSAPSKTFTPGAVLLDVSADVVLAAEPPDGEWLGVVVVVPVRVGVSADLAWLGVGEGSSGGCPCQDALAVVGIAGVPVSAVGLDALGVAAVVGRPVGELLDGLAAGLAEVAASLGAESSAGLGWLEGLSAVVARSWRHATTLSPSDHSTRLKNRDAPPESPGLAFSSPVKVPPL